MLGPQRRRIQSGARDEVDRSELLCNKEKASDIGIRRGHKEYLLASVSNEVIYSPMNPKNVRRL